LGGLIRKIFQKGGKRVKKFLKLMGVLSISLVLVAGVSYAQKGNPNPEPPGQDKDFPGAKVFEAATPNLSFPVVMTDVIETFFQKVWVDENADGVCDANEWVIGYDTNGDGLADTNVWAEGAVLAPILVDEVISEQYGGTYAGNEDTYYTAYIVDDTTGCPYDTLTQIWEDTDGDGIIELEEYTEIADTPDGNPDYTAPVYMYDWLIANQPWYDQPVYMDAALTETVTAVDGVTTATIYSYENPNNIWNVAYLDGSVLGGENSWQADWVLAEDDDEDPFTPVVYVDFIDWGNPLENTVTPVVGQRFPVEIALYQRLAETMTSYKMACLENPGSKDEVFGTSTLGTGEFTKEVYFATILTNKFSAEVWNPNGTITTIPIEPGIGPSGKMNFASAGGGWIPELAGWHRIWLHFNDPLLTLSGAVVNNDEHYVMTTGCMAEGLNQNKAELVGVVGNSTYIDVLVALPNGKIPKSKKIK
jgi:hypothetical protein